MLHSPSSAQNGNRKKRQSQPVSLVVIFKVFFIIVYTYNKYRKRKRTVNSAAISAVVDFTYVNNRQFFQSLAQVNVEFPRRNLLRSASMYDGPMVCNHYNTTAYPINFWNSMFFTWWASKLSCCLTHYRTYLYPEYTLLHSEKKHCAWKINQIKLLTAFSYNRNVYNTRLADHNISGWSNTRKETWTCRQWPDVILILL